MPSLGQGRFIEAAAESVLATRPAGVLLVQDGGSDDDTADDTTNALARVAARHPGLLLRREPDDGPAQALNRAFRRALDTGAPVIGWLNSDDLYTPGAIGRALEHLRRHPGHVAVYGEGEHIDADGRVLGPYPSERPDAPLERWRDACPVCQPTMFLRRGAIEALLPLDETLRTAFDFELWLRLWHAFPGRIGFVPAVQAQSRLHAGTITQRQRERVALEAMAVVHRHLGAAPGHWLVTHAAEALAACRLASGDDDEVDALKQHLLSLADQAAGWLAPGGVEPLKAQLRASRAWQLAQRGFVAGVQADGWAGPVLELHLRQPADTSRRVGTLRLHARHAWPRPGRLWLPVSAWHEGRRLAAGGGWWRRRFVLDVPLPRPQPGARQTIELRAGAHFVPAQVLRGSRDARRLAFVVEAVELLAGAAAH